MQYPKFINSRDTPENTLSEEFKNKLNKIKEIEKTVDREKL